MTRDDHSVERRNRLQRPLVACERGAIQLRHPTLFAQPTGNDCLGFISRLCTLNQVQSIEITHPIGSATIRFADELSPADMLRLAAGALRAADAREQDQNLSSLLSLASDREWTRVFRRGEILSVWQMSRQNDDQLCLKHEVVSRSGHITEKLCRELATLPAVGRVTTDVPSSSLIVQLTAAELDEWHLLKVADEIAHGAVGIDMPETVKMELVDTLSRVERGLNLALAGASFGMAVVGVAVPGIPTVPFLLVTSFFLVRSSPTLNDRLLRSRMFGPLIRDWQRHRGLRWRVKAGAVAFTVFMIGLTVVLVEPSWPLLATMLGLGGLGMYFVLRLPTVPVEAEEPGEVTAAEMPALRVVGTYT